MGLRFVAFCERYENLTMRFRSLHEDSPGLSTQPNGRFLLPDGSRTGRDADLHHHQQHRREPVIHVDPAWFLPGSPLEYRHKERYERSLRPLLLSPGEGGTDLETLEVAS